MAAQQLLPRQSRTGRVESADRLIPVTAGKKLQIMSNIGNTDLADPDKWVYMAIDVKDATVPGGYRLAAGGAVDFQCGPTPPCKGCPNDPNGLNRGFSVDLAELAGKTVRGVLELRDFGSTGPFTTMTIGVTYEVLG